MSRTCVQTRTHIQQAIKAHSYIEQAANPQQKISNSVETARFAGEWYDHSLIGIDLPPRVADDTLLTEAILFLSEY